jgi:hypothetical protein
LEGLKVRGLREWERGKRVEFCEIPSRKLTIQKSIVKLSCAYSWHTANYKISRNLLTKGVSRCIFADGFDVNL